MKGGLLERDEVIKARKLEMDYFRKMGGVLKSPEGGGTGVRG